MERCLVLNTSALTGNFHCSPTPRVGNTDPGGDARLFDQVGVPEFGALGAHAVGKFDVKAIADIGFDLLPASGGLVDFFAGSANGQMFAGSGSGSVCRGGGVLRLREL